MHIALPKHRFSSILEIKPKDIHDMGAKAIAFDLDNTTVYDSRLRIKKGADKWVKSMKEAGFPIMIITNTSEFRAKRLAKIFNVDYIATARKPSTMAYFEAAKRLNVKMSELAMIGDQLFKDVEGANRAGAISVLVKPFMTEKLFYPYYYKIRKKEKLLLKKYNLQW